MPKILNISIPYLFKRRKNIYHIQQILSYALSTETNILWGPQQNQSNRKISLCRVDTHKLVHSFLRVSLIMGLKFLFRVSDMDDRITFE